MDNMTDNTMQICDTEITVKEYAGQRVVTFKDIDRVHNRPEGTARKRFNDNREHFIEDEDFFKVKCSEVRPFFGQTPPNGFNPEGDIVLITESGYLMLVKSFTDDLAWRVQRELVNCYFRAKREARREDAVIKRPLTMDDYTEAARTIAKCHNSRLPLVISLYMRAGLDMSAMREAVIVAKEEKAEEAKADERDERLLELMNKFTLAELTEMLKICKTSLYYYKTGKHKPYEKRREYIISILEKNDESGGDGA